MRQNTYFNGPKSFVQSIDGKKVKEVHYKDAIKSLQKLLIHLLIIENKQVNGRRFFGRRVGGKSGVFGDENRDDNRLNYVKEHTKQNGKLFWIMFRN